MGVIVVIMVWLVMVFFYPAFFYGVGENTVPPPVKS